MILAKPRWDTGFWLTKLRYSVGDNIQMIFRNAGRKPVKLSTTAPWQITTPDGKEVHTPIGAAIIVVVGPNEATIYSWDQKGKDQKQVEPGKYVAVLPVAKKKYKAPFEIT